MIITFSNYPNYTINTGICVDGCTIFGGSFNIELGYIMRKDKQRQGYAYEGLSAILMYVAEHFGVKQVRVRVHKDNNPSVRLAEKLGAKFASEVVDEHIVGYIEL